MKAHEDGYDRGMSDQDPLSEQEFWEIYRRVPRLTVEVAVTGDQGLLLTRRAIEPCRGIWHLPGGTVRFGERLAEAVGRVARRELGIEVLESRMLGYIEYPSHWESGLDSPVGIVFLVTRHAGTLAVSAEADAHGWFRRLPAGMHAEQVRFLDETGLAAPPPDGAESADIDSRRMDSGD
jgi:ADP-ribose pyrophosphatase YjhB (NUDIX family)